MNIRTLTSDTYAQWTISAFADLYLSEQALSKALIISALMSSLQRQFLCLRMCFSCTTNLNLLNIIMFIWSVFVTHIFFFFTLLFFFTFDEDTIALLHLKMFFMHCFSWYSKFCLNRHLCDPFHCEIRCSFEFPIYYVL